MVILSVIAVGALNATVDLKVVAMAAAKVLIVGILVVVVILSLLSSSL